MSSITEEQVIRFILGELQAGRGGWVVTHNLDHLRRLQRDASFAEICTTADLVVADGMPLVWASRLQRSPLPQRVTGSSLTSSLSAAAAREARSIFLLGGAPGTADAAAQVLRDRHPDVRMPPKSTTRPLLPSHASRLLCRASGPCSATTRMRPSITVNVRPDMRFL